MEERRENVCWEREKEGNERGLCFWNGYLSNGNLEWERTCEVCIELHGRKRRLVCNSNTEYDDHDHDHTHCTCCSGKC
jgi:hypothetical protein